MKHALLVGVPERDAEGRLDRAPGVDAIAALLDELGGWSISVCTGQGATRSRVLEGLDAMVSACRAEDACLLYFFGHGGVVRFSGLAGDLGSRVVFYLATLRPPGSRQRVGVLDVEVSTALARLDRVCGNVTAIIDCCHAASMVRDGPIPTVAPPPWVEALVGAGGDERAGDPLLATVGHPRIVRLVGSSSLRSAYATKQAEGRYGLMTQCFVEVVREAGLRCDRLTWDAVAHRAREWASRQRGTEEQRVVLAGPRNRLLFARETVAQPRSVAFVPASSPGRGWIRAGLLQGVRTGDRWGIAELELGPSLEPRLRTEARVTRVDLDGSEVVLGDPSSSPPLGASAIMQGLQVPLAVVVEGAPAVERALRSSGLVRAARVAMPAAVARVRGVGQAGSRVDVEDDEGRVVWPEVSLDAKGLPMLLELLEDRARARRLEQALAAATATAAEETELEWEWGTLGPDEELRPWPSSGAGAPRIHVGDRLWLRLGHRGTTPRRWFVSVLQVDIEGRLGLLNVHEPEGIEVVAGVPTYVGLRGHRRRQGLTCGWPERVPRDGPRPSRLIILGSRRPISMGHLVRLPEPDDPTAFAAQGLGLGASRRTRGEELRPFVTSEAWTWGEIRLEVDPRPRRDEGAW